MRVRARLGGSLAGGVVVEPHVDADAHRPHVRRLARVDVPARHVGATHLGCEEVRRAARHLVRVRDRVRVRVRVRDRVS